MDVECLSSRYIYVLPTKLLVDNKANKQPSFHGLTQQLGPIPGIFCSMFLALS